MSQISKQLIRLQSIAKGVNELKTKDPELNKFIVVINHGHSPNPKIGYLELNFNDYD